MPELCRTKLARGRDEFERQQPTIPPERQNLVPQMHPEGSVPMQLSDPEKASLNLGSAQI